MPFEKVSTDAGNDFASVNRAFSKQSVQYDQEDADNMILQAWRKQVYHHVERFLQPGSRILELNSGTGIDALYFASQGHAVHCTDLSDGMIDQVKKKILNSALKERLTCQQCSYDALDVVNGSFDYVFSNFGGLNCIDDLTRVTRHLHRLMKPGAFITIVIMPPVCLWEIRWIFRGDFKNAFRRFHKNGMLAHVEGEYFRTFYHSLSTIKKAFAGFQHVGSEGIGALSPPPADHLFPGKHPAIYRFLDGLDKTMRNHFPFNRCADHIMVTFKHIGDKT